MATREYIFENEEVQVYGGVVKDFCMVYYGTMDAFGNGPGCLLLPLGLIDFPISFAADTVMLPATIPLMVNVESEKTRSAKISKLYDNVYNIYIYGQNQGGLEKYSEEFKSYLSEEGIDINTRNRKGNTILFEGLSHYEITLFLLKHGADPNLKNNDGETVLIIASDCKADDKFSIIKLLISSGAVINVKDNYGNCALGTEIACDDNTSRYKIIELLLESGADLNMRDNEGRYILMRAINSPRKDYMKRINSERLKIVKLLVERGARLDAQDIRGRTVLMSAAGLFRIPGTFDSQDMAIFTTLLDRRADVNIKDKE